MRKWAGRTALVRPMIRPRDLVSSTLCREADKRILRNQRIVAAIICLAVIAYIIWAFLERAK